MGRRTKGNRTEVVGRLALVAMLLALGTASVGCLKGAPSSGRSTKAKTGAPGGTSLLGDIPTDGPPPSGPAPTSTPSPTPSPTSSGPVGPPGTAGATPAGQIIPAGAAIPCLLNPSCDACVALKGLVAQNGAALPNGQRLNSDNVPSYCVKLNAIDRTGNPDGLLKNRSYVNSPTTVTQVRYDATLDANANPRSYRIPYRSGTAADPNRSFGQLMMFYWLNRQNTWMADPANAGIAFTANRGVLVDSNKGPGFNAYFNPTDNSIRFLYHVQASGGVPAFGCSTQPGGACPFSHDAGVTAHENGHAYMQWAGMGIINASGTVASRCGLPAQGFNEGQSDFVAAALFDTFTTTELPVVTRTILGENVSNDTVGLPDRDVTQNGTRLFTLTAGAIPEIECHEAGRVAASVLWKLYRNQANATPVAGHVPGDILKIWAATIREVSGNDSWTTIAQLMIGNATGPTLGKYAAAIAAEWRYRRVPGI